MGETQNQHLPVADVSRNRTADSSATTPSTESSVIREATAAAANAAHTSDRQCVVCMTDPPTMILLPCGHICCCDQCVRAIRDARPSTCPLCRAHVSSTTRVYW